jgi:hypothetical protein
MLPCGAGLTTCVRLMLRHQGTSLMGEISMSGDSPDGSWKGFLEEGALRKGLALLSGASTAPPPSGVGLASCDLPGSGNGSAHASIIIIIIIAGRCTHDAL